MSMFSRPLLVASVAVLACSAAVCLAAETKPDPRAEIARKLPFGGVKAEELAATPVPGIYELRRGTEIAYVSSDGRYLFSGDLHDLKTNNNLTETRRTASRKQLLASLPESQMMIFGPQSAQYTVTVFTDVDCGYCRKLHSEIAEYNRLGIRVRYLFYPREGPGSEGWKTAEAIWCSPDRKDALTRAKRGEEIKAGSCGNSPVMRQYELGQTLGIHGTPGIFTAAGDYISGYLPPPLLLARLQKNANN